MVLNFREQFLADSLCRYFGGSYRLGEDPPNFYLLIDGKEVAVEASTIVQQVPNAQHVLVSRNSQDSGVVRVGRELNSEIGAFVKDDQRIILTLFSPIECLRKFKTQLINCAIDFINSDYENRFVDILSNKVKISRYQNNGKKKISCIVANRCSSPCINENAYFSFIKILRQKALKCNKVASAELWLCLFNEYFLADVKDYSDSLAGVKFEHPFKKILIVSYNGNIDAIL